MSLAAAQVERENQEDGEKYVLRRLKLAELLVAVGRGKEAAGQLQGVLDAAATPEARLQALCLLADLQVGDVRTLLGSPHEHFWLCRCAPVGFGLEKECLKRWPVIFLGVMCFFILHGYFWLVLFSKWNRVV